MRKTTSLQIICVIFLAFLSCTEEPSAPSHTNPFDPNNPETGGTGIVLNAKIANGGITLDWNKPEVKNLRYFRLYKSESEQIGYDLIITVNDTILSFLDMNIENGHSYWYKVTAINQNNQETSISNSAEVNINTDPVLVINGGAEYTSERNVTLTILAMTATAMMLSEKGDFSAAVWENYATSKQFQLSSGAGEKKVYLKVKYENGKESIIIQDSIIPNPVTNYSFTIGEKDTLNTLNTTLYIKADGAKKMMIGNSGDLSDAAWEDFATTKEWHLYFADKRAYTTNVFMKFKNDFDMETEIIGQDVFLEIVSGVSINGGDQYTAARTVTLSLLSENANEMMITNNSTFSEAVWEPYTITKAWELPVGNTQYIVYCKFRNSSGLVSSVYSDQISVLPMQPQIIIANRSEYTLNQSVNIGLSAYGMNLQMKVSEDSTFGECNWTGLSAINNFQLSESNGIKVVYTIIKNDFEIESEIIWDSIILDTKSPQLAISFSPDSGITNETNFQFDPTLSTDNLTSSEELLFRLDYENDGIFDVDWKQLSIINKIYNEGGGGKSVKIELKDMAGWVIDTTFAIFVNTRPVASFINSNNPKKLNSYHFDASGSSDNEDGKNLEYLWDFNGDGAWDTEWSTIDTISHLYSADGEYNLTLEVRDQFGLTKEISTAISVLSKVTDIDGNIYKVIKIGNQFWIAENLKVTHYNNGEEIPFVPIGSEWINQVAGAYCFYDNDTSNISEYGMLYNWFAVEDSRNIAPEGWHVPTIEEWQSLIDYLGGGYVAGGKMKEIGFEHWNGPNIGATNESGFTALPGGYRSDYGGTFYSIGDIVYFWSSIEFDDYNGNNAWECVINYGHSDADLSNGYKGWGHSVRCIRDQ